MKGFEMNDANAVEVTQTVNASPVSIVVTLRMKNTHDMPVLVENINWDESDPLRREFAITSDGKEISYTGIMMKRAPYTREDFILLKPNEETIRTTRIDQTYAFLPGDREYQIVHWHLRYDERTGEVSSHPSRPAIFRFEK